MALILNIDTATNFASVCISNNQGIVGFAQNSDQKQHAAFLHVAISEICESSGIQLTDLDGVAVTSGPGSYTGLRVGMASAKGICYALGKPLITINTVQVMAQSMQTNPEIATLDQRNLLFCPMIDARRMEVFTAVYSADLQTVLAPGVMELDQTSFQDLLNFNTIAFFGSGSAKFEPLFKHRNAKFFENHSSAKNLAVLAFEAFQRKAFADIAYSEPFYAKEFYSTKKVDPS